MEHNGNVSFFWWSYFFGRRAGIRKREGVWLVKLTVHLERAIEETSRKERKKKLSLQKTTKQLVHEKFSEHSN